MTPQGPVFISHAHQDKPLVGRLRSALEESGFSTWVDEHELLPGDDLPGSVASALADAGAFVIVISAHSTGSRWLRYELQLATQRMIEGDLLIIPIRVDDAELPPEIRSLLWADFRTRFEDGWRVVEASLDRWANRPDELGETTPVRPSLAFNLNAARLTRVNTILSEYVPEVFRAVRVLEARTGYSSRIASSNLVDALAHLSALATREELTEVEQDRQIAQIDEHCQRALTESAEEVVRHRISEVAELWSEYIRQTSRYRAKNMLAGAPKHSELERLRAQMAAQVEKARVLRLSGTWDDARLAAAEWHEVATLCEELTDRILESIAVAEDVKRRDKNLLRRFRLRDSASGQGS